MSAPASGQDPLERLAQAPTSPEAWVGAVRTRLLGRTMGYLWAGLAVLLVSAIAAWLAVGAPTEPGRQVPWLRIALLALGGVAVGASLCALAARLGRRPGQALRRIRSIQPALGDDLESALELSSMQAGGPGASSPVVTPPGVTPQGTTPLGQSFARCHRERVVGGLMEHPPADLVPMRGPMRVFQASVLLATVVSLGLVLVPEAPMRLSAEIGLQGGPDLLPWVLTGPAARPVAVEVRPPKYTGLAPRSHTPGEAPTQLPEGSWVSVLLEADHAVTTVKAALPGGETTRGEILGDNVLRVRFTARQDGMLTLALREPSGALRVGAGGPAFRILPDRPPGISVQPPTAVIRLERAQPLGLRWESDDDYGVTAVRLVFTVDDTPPRQVELFRGSRFGKGREQRVSGKHRWDLTALRLAPGARVQFHLEAEDNRSLSGGSGGPGKTSSVSQEVRIEGSREARLDVLEGVRPVLAATLTALADRYERFVGEVRSSACAEALRELGRQRGQELVLSTSFSAFVSRVRAMAAELPPLLGQVFDGPLQRLGERLASVTRADRARGQPSTGSDCLGSARPTGMLVVETLEELTLQLDALTGRATLEEMKDLVRRADELRKEIRRLAESLRRRPDEAKRRELVARTGELRQTLARLSRLAASLGDEVLDEHVNRYALGEGQRERLLDPLGRQNGSDPLAALDRMVSQLQEAVGQGLDRFRQVMPIPGEGARSRHAEALRSLTQRQRDLQGEVGQARDPKGHADAQRKLAQEARRLAQTAPDQAGRPPGAGRQGEPRGARSLREAAQRMEEAAGAVGRGDAKAAKRLGQEALGMLRHLQALAERAGRVSAPSAAAGERLDGPGEVEVPPAGGALPRELRESIQEAGRAVWPESYRDALRRYYGRLLR